MMMTTKEEEFSSYPPLFREYNRQEIPNPNNQSSPDSSTLLPLIDLQDLNQTDLRQACRVWGAFLLINHGVPTSLFGQLRDQSKKLFSLPFESKQAQFKHPIAYFWGSPVVEDGVTMEEKAKNLNWIEGFSVFQNKLPQSKSEDPMHESYRCLLEEYGTHMDRICTSLFVAIAKDLGLDSAQVEASLSLGDSMFRAYRYPRCSMPDEVPGFFEHTDNTVISILHRGEAQGLELLKDNTWINVKPVSNALIIIRGDMMQAISSDEYKAVTHKVLASEIEERLSICYFSVPKPDAVIQNSKYKPFTFLEYTAAVSQVFKATRRKAGLETFKLVEAAGDDAKRDP